MVIAFSHSTCRCYTAHHLRGVWPPHPICFTRGVFSRRSEPWLLTQVTYHWTNYGGAGWFHRHSSGSVGSSTHNFTGWESHMHDMWTADQPITFIGRDVFTPFAHMANQSQESQKCPEIPKYLTKGYASLVVWMDPLPTSFRSKECSQYYWTTLIWIILPVHTWSAGSGVQFPVARHIELIRSIGTNPSLHLNDISEPSVLWMGSLMEPFPGWVGTPQLTRWKSDVSGTLERQRQNEYICTYGTIGDMGDVPKTYVSILNVIIASHVCSI